jgi:predicted O-linked N-acetylglucosamine transferase (SPINDLY family)
MLKTKHNSGFFSCCSVRLHDIISYFNTNKCLPTEVDSSEHFGLYKKDSTKDITFDYFKQCSNSTSIIYSRPVPFHHEDQFAVYSQLDYTALTPFVQAYFSPSPSILQRVEALQKKYSIHPENTCVLFYRGNDKVTEIGMCSYQEMLEQAALILDKHPNIQFLLQSDETDFLEEAKKRFPTNSFHFNEEIRHMRKQISSVDKVYSEKNDEFSKWYLAITILMSTCNYVVCGSGNCSIWITLYRGNATNIIQHRHDHWIDFSKNTASSESLAHKSYQYFLNQWHSYSSSITEPLQKTLEEQAAALLQDTMVPLDKKQDIVSKMIYMNPDKHEWYYQMAQLVQHDSQIIMWLRLAYEKKPNDYPTLYALCKTLFMNNQHKLLFDLNRNHLFDPFIESKNGVNAEFLYYFFESSMTLHYHKNSEKYVAMLESYFKTVTTLEPDVIHHKCINYVDCAKVQYVLGNIESAITYVEKSIQFIIKHHFPSDKLILSTQHLLSLYDYLYYDHVKQFKKYSELNEFFSKGIIPFSVPNKRKNKTQLKIGYVTSDLGLHAVSNFIHSILKHHTYEAVVFANQTAIHPMFRSFNIVQIRHLSDKEAAYEIMKNEIDILIDLNGHTSLNRLGIFPYQPAPIQMTYLGYPNTTGLTSIQYRITDSVADPPHSKQLYSEKLLRMPSCFLLYKSSFQTEPLVPRKTKQTIILGSLNKEPKITPPTLRVWAKILKENPNTKLLIKLESYDNTDSRLAYYMKHLRVDKQRLLLLTRTDDEQYTKLFGMIDIALDTFPYSGTTTTCNALYNSIPVVTMTHDDYHVHNVSASLLKNAGLAELVTKSETEYVERVTALVNSVETIDRYKATIHAKFVESMNPVPFMKAYESLLYTTHATHATHATHTKNATHATFSM